MNNVNTFDEKFWEAFIYIFIVIHVSLGVSNLHSPNKWSCMPKH